MINDDIKGSALIRDGRITTSDVQDKAITFEKLADEVTAAIDAGQGGGRCFAHRF